MGMREVQHQPRRVQLRFPRRLLLQQPRELSFLPVSATEVGSSSVVQASSDRSIRVQGA